MILVDKVVHFEIPADNTARAKKFYESVFSWKIEEYPGFDYFGVHTTSIDEKTHMPKETGAINGGMLKKQHPIKNPVITINVKSIDDAVLKIKKAGGKVIREKMPVDDMGFAAYFQDTEGNVLGLWQDNK